MNRLLWMYHVIQRILLVFAISFLMCALISCVLLTKAVLFVYPSLTILFHFIFLQIILIDIFSFFKRMYCHLFLIQFLFWFGGVCLQGLWPGRERNKWAAIACFLSIHYYYNYNYLQFCWFVFRFGFLLFFPFFIEQSKKNSCGLCDSRPMRTCHLRHVHLFIAFFSPSKKLRHLSFPSWML